MYLSICLGVKASERHNSSGIFYLFSLNSHLFLLSEHVLLLLQLIGGTLRTCKFLLLQLGRLLSTLFFLGNLLSTKLFL